MRSSYSDWTNWIQPRYSPSWNSRLLNGKNMGKYRECPRLLSGLNKKSMRSELTWTKKWSCCYDLISLFYQGFHGMMQCVSCWLTWLSGHQHLPKEAWVGFSYITLDSAFRKGKLQDGKVMNQNQPFTHRFSMLFAYFFGIHCHCI